MRSWCSMISMVVIAIVAGLGWSAVAAAQVEFKLTASDAAAADLFGQSVSIDGDYAIVGANGNDDGGTSSGSAYIFKRSGTTWSQQAKLTASDAAQNDDFGTSVSISGDYAIVGAHANDDGGSYSGSAYIFVRSGTNWTEQAKLTASDAAASDYFGYSVSIDGDYAIVGAHANDDGGSDSGSAYIFVRSGTNWTQQTKLTALDGGVGDAFGYSVSIAGDYAIVGAYLDEDPGFLTGSAYIFTRSGESWSEQSKLTASDGSVRFGYSVSIAGDHAIVGAYRDDDAGSYSGSAYIFVRSGTTWTEQDKLTASDAAQGDLFGTSVSIAGDHAIVGAVSNDDDGEASGSAYVYYAIPAVTLSLGTAFGAPANAVSIPATMTNLNTGRPVGGLQFAVLLADTV
ncbi:MAG: FG-GAP repeat protein, partial [Candidatus Latescibacteria bacterium]|nr:FG-GAP repeat protein [Candidatus Latescibacterota bacterium]